MNRTKNLILLLMVCSIATFSLLTMTSCETKPVDSLSPEPAPPPDAVSQVAGEITDNVTDAGLSDVTVQLDGFSTTTDASGNFEFTDNIPGGNYTLTAQRSGYISISRTVSVIGPGATTYLKYKMAEEEPPIVVVPDEGTLIEVQSNDGTLKAFFPANTFPTSEDVSLTPTLGLSSPIPTDDLLNSNEAPLQTFRITPDNVNYAQPVTITVPLTMPAQYITGAIEVVRVNVETGQAQVVGNASIVSGELVHDITIGGDYMLRAATQLRHTRTSASGSEIIGKIDEDELPGTGIIFDFDDESVVQIEPGFSRDLIETIFRFTNSSRTLQYGLTKPSGINTTITGYLPVVNETQVFSTPTGKIIASVTAQNNRGTRYESVGTASSLFDYRCRQASNTHNNWDDVGYFRTSTGVQLTQSQVDSLKALNILPATPPSCP